MPPQQTVLLVGGTGRTGRHALQQLLSRGVGVRAIVRSGGKLPPEVAGNPNLTVIEASLLALSDDELQRHLAGCDAVVSCLGHVDADLHIRLLRLPRSQPPSSVRLSAAEGVRGPRCAAFSGYSLHANLWISYAASFSPSHLGA